MIPIEGWIYFFNLIPATIVIGFFLHLIFWIGFQFFINN